MHTLKKTILLVGAVIIAAIILLAVWVISNNSSAPDSTPNNVSEESSEPTVLSETGTIASINGNELSIETDSGTQKSVTVRPNHKVYVRGTSENGSATRMEVGLDRLETGETVEIVHSSIGENITNIKSITADINQSISDYLEQNNSDQTMRVQVVNLDLTNRILSYNPVDRYGDSLEDINLDDITLADDITVTEVTDSDRARFSHARTPSPVNLEDIQPGFVVTVVVIPTDSGLTAETIVLTSVNN